MKLSKVFELSLLGLALISTALSCVQCSLNFNSGALFSEKTNRSEDAVNIVQAELLYSKVIGIEFHLSQARSFHLGITQSFI